jgi:hypothetical protein
MGAIVVTKIIPWSDGAMERGGRTMAALTSMFKDLSASQAFDRSEA